MSAMSACCDRRNIVQYYSAWFEKKGLELFIQMELCAQGSLRGLCDREELSAEQVLTMTLHAARGLDAMHKVGLIHGDVKPENLLLSAEGVYKLGDFGLTARAVGSDGTDTEGDGRYLCKRLLSDTHSPRDLVLADIFALGVVALEVGSGVKAPSAGIDWHQIRDGQGAFYDRTMSALRTRCGDSFADLIARCISRDPLQRPDAGQLVLYVESIAKPSSPEQDSIVQQQRREYVLPHRRAGTKQKREGKKKSYTSTTQPASSPQVLPCH